LDGARRILLVKPSALGDVVHALPVVATLKRRYPEVPLDWLIEEEAAPLLAGHPGVADFVVSGRRRWQRQLWNPRQVPGVLGEIRTFVGEIRRRRYDVVLDLQGLFKSVLYVAASGASIRVGLADGREGARWALTHRVPVPPQPVHAVDRYLALAAAVDAREAVRDFTIPLAPSDREAAEAFLADLPRPCVVLHPAARWKTKLWEVERWRALAAALASGGMGVAITGSAADAPTAAAICAGLTPAPRSLAGRLSLKQLAAVLARADLMITVDSGPMHVAAALNTRVLALFGPTDPARTGPRGPGRVLRRPLPCSPCLRRRCQIPDTRRCMRDLEVDEVLAAAAELLGRGVQSQSKASARHGDRDPS
jgi:lipopolysaccharide heptosyltransferase I